MISIDDIVPLTDAFAVNIVKGQSIFWKKKKKNFVNIYVLWSISIWKILRNITFIYKRHILSMLNSFYFRFYSEIFNVFLFFTAHTIKRDIWNIIITHGSN